MSTPTLSIVIPALNEAENAPPLIAEIEQIAHKIPLIEIIFVDDGSTDNTIEVLQALREKNPMIRILKHDHRARQSAAMMTGARTARGDLIVTMDGDGQNDPSDIPMLYEMFLKKNINDNIGLVAGQRRKRNDNFIRRLSSRIANNVRSALLKDGVRDTGCSLKLMRKDMYIHLPYFSHMHRFLPALIRREGYDIVTVDVNHRPRLRGVSKYGMMNRLWVGIVDLFGVMWLQARASQPGRVDEV